VGVSTAQTITEIIDSTGDGGGNTLSGPFGITVDASGNVYVTGFDSHNAFKIAPAASPSLPRGTIFRFH